MDTSYSVLTLILTCIYFKPIFEGSLVFWLHRNASSWLKNGDLAIVVTISWCEWSKINFCFVSFRAQSLPL